MNRDDVIINIAQIGALSPYAMNIGVILPTAADCLLFRNQLVDKFSEVPGWLMSPPTVGARNMIKLQSDTCIWFMHNVHHTRGHTFNRVYVSSRVKDEQLSEFIFTLLPAMVNNTTITFEDE